MSLNKVLNGLLEDSHLGYADVERNSGMRYQSIKDALDVNSNDTNSLRLILSIAELTKTSVDEILVKAGKLKESTINRTHPLGNIKYIQRLPKTGENGKLDHQMIYIPGFEGEQGLMMINVNGDNMEGLIADSDYVVFKEMGSAALIPGKVYIFEMKDQFVLKRLKNVGDAGIIVTSDNTFYAPLVLKRDDIKNIYIVKGFVSKNTSPRIAYA